MTTKKSSAVNLLNAGSATLSGARKHRLMLKFLSFPSHTYDNLTGENTPYLAIYTNFAVQRSVRHARSILCASKVASSWNAQNANINSVGTAWMNSTPNTITTIQIVHSGTVCSIL